MVKFNSEHIFVGYLKQLLASFELPKYRVYTPEDELYAEEHGKEAPNIINTVVDEEAGADGWKPSESYTRYPDNMLYADYIKNDAIQRLVNGKWKTIGHYHYGKKILNATKKLNLINNSYDSYTHEYLGDYLRFQRDYNGLDLMPLYNCFSDRICQNLHIHMSLGEDAKVEFDTDDAGHKIYMLPIKLFKEYTIAIDCDSSVEVCCGFFGKYYDDRPKLAGLPLATYEALGPTRFNEPKVFKLVDLEHMSAIKERNNGQDFDEYVKNESCLKLFIKLPSENKSSIAVLEGDYSGNSQRSIWKLGGDVLQRPAITVTNYEEDDAHPSMNDRKFDPKPNLQLLSLNTGTSYPFSDRLIEYLSDNAVTHLDELTDNVKRAQEVMSINGIYFSKFGLWEPKMRNIVYDYMNSVHADNSGFAPMASAVDCLGYIDKDVEKYYTGFKTDLKTGKKTAVSTIKNVDLYDELYK